MRRYRLEITAQADNDLRSLYEYIAYELLAPESAASQLDRLEEAIGRLDRFPERTSLYGKEPWRSRGLRVFPVDNYVVYYIPYQDESVVKVLRVLYKGRDRDGELMDRTTL